MWRRTSGASHAPGSAPRTPARPFKGIRRPRQLPSFIARVRCGGRIGYRLGARDTVACSYLTASPQTHACLIDRSITVRGSEKLERTVAKVLFRLAKNLPHSAIGRSLLRSLARAIWYPREPSLEPNAPAATIREEADE